MNSHIDFPLYIVGLTPTGVLYLLVVNHFNKLIENDILDYDVQNNIKIQLLK